MPGRDTFVFAALGGLGEIGMNAALYGFGPARKRKWLLVDCGISFAGEDLPGIDVLMPDMSFLEAHRDDLVAILITHAHEDHIGALVDLWPRLRAPVYATAFAANLLEVRRLNEAGAPDLRINVVAPGDVLDLKPFSVEWINVAHSIPESNALAITTPLGTALHTGDWKIDETPPIGKPTDVARLKELGEQGILALICDSTNVMREGISPSEMEVGKNLAQIIGESPGRVAVTTFASNVARLRSVAEAARANGRHVVVVGRAMDRVIDVARERGYLDGIPPFLSAENYMRLPRDKVVLLLTGSQGEPRAALARVATDDHPDIRLAAGDRVIMSSRAIPGNERAINRIINSLILQGVEIITDRHGLVHVSGHPRRDEMAAMYAWTKPRIAIPAHGEPQHLAEHRAFARKQGVAEVVTARDGDVVQLAPGPATVIDQIDAGQLYRDGNLLVRAEESAVGERRKLAFAGVVSVAIAIDGKGELSGVPQVALMGLPARTRDGKSVEEIVGSVVDDALQNMPKGRRRDPDAVETAVDRAVRSAVQNLWGKKPAVHALVVEV
jgi:ribonuclease J